MPQYEHKSGMIIQRCANGWCYVPVTHV